MNMQEHVLAALREQFERWEILLAHLPEQQMTAPVFELNWSIQDVIAHLWAWQQISLARLEAAVLDREPVYPPWIVKNVENWEENADQVNKVTFESQHGSLWKEVYTNWRNGFIQLIELGHKLSERNLLDGDRYPWLKGHSLASILIASYDHHQEHYEKLTIWLQDQASS